MTTVSRPFSERVRQLNQVEGRRYIDMQFDSKEARSAAWWNNVANGNRVAPPPPEKLADIAPVLGVDEKEAAEMVAREWYGVTAEAPQSARAQGLETLMDKLSDEDLKLVERLVKRLAG